MYEWLYPIIMNRDQVRSSNAVLLTRLKPLNGTYLTEQRLGYIATFSCYEYDTMRGHTDDERRVGGPLALGRCRIHILQS